MRFSFAIQNVFVLTNYSGADPQVEGNGGNRKQRGIGSLSRDITNTPHPRTYTATFKFHIIKKKTIKIEKNQYMPFLPFSVLFASCDSWVENAETPSNTLTRDQLNKSAMVANIQSNSITDGPLVAYVKTLQGRCLCCSLPRFG